MSDYWDHATADSLVVGDLVLWRYEAWEVVDVRERPAPERLSDDADEKEVDHAAQQRERDAKEAHWNAFKTREPADMWVAVEFRHGDQRFNLIFHPRYQVARVHKHHPRCADCGGLWPCLDRRRDTEATRLIWKLQDACQHCDKPLAGKARVDVVTPDGVKHRFHWAKKYTGCRRAAAKEAAEYGMVIEEVGAGSFSYPRCVPNPGPTEGQML